MKRNLVPFAMVLIALSVLALSGATGPVASPTVQSIAPPGKLIWADEFEGEAGAKPDPSRWRRETGGGGWGNGELQFYTNSANNASLDGNGNLAITARRGSPEGASCHYGTCLYTSARLVSADRFSQAYGRFEARLKVPKGKGFWPAFWMLGENFYTDGWPVSGEIDVVENVGHEPDVVTGSLHGPGYSGVRSVTGSYRLPGGQELGDAFHVFTTDWTPDSVTWYVDGVQFLQKTRADIPGTWVFDHQFFLLLNLAVGGHWPGPPDQDSRFPQSFLVDYVRVYQLPRSNEGHEFLIRGQEGKCISSQGPRVAGAALVLGDCGAAGSGVWSFNLDGTVRSSGLCMEADGVSSWTTSVDNGVRLRLGDCDGSPGQQFQLTEAGDLVNPRSGKCADIAGGISDSAGWLQLWDCAGSANQKWRMTT
jgi:beta-glucanase (GH16 family)